MLKEFTETYAPPKLLHREKEIGSIQAVFDEYERDGSAGNICVRGFTGSGKTAMARHIIKQNPQKVIYINISETKTAFRTMQSILPEKEADTFKILPKIIDYINTQQKILILDEVNKCRDPKKLYDDLNHIRRHTDAPIICITNKLTFQDDMPEDAKLTLFFRKVDLPSYTTIEIYDIIKERINEAEQRTNRTISIPPEVMSKICAIGAREGSARTAIDLVGYCIETNNFTQENLDFWWANRTREDQKEIFRKMNLTEKQVFLTILELLNNQRKITSADIRNRIKDVTPGRVSQIITDLYEKYGLIQVTHQNLGRAGGTFRIITIPEAQLNELQEIIPLGIRE